ncbi:MAG: hypothetical protein M3N18_09970 [Actinomycetota bacterium]|nr:hypothetical protein [Actinomycetota bacterium]
MSEEVLKKNNRGVVPEGERCRGWSRTAGRPCRQRRVPGSGFCHYHGGKNAKGGAHPNYRHGKRSKYRPPAEMLAAYERFLRDPDLAHHRNSVAILDAMIQYLFDHYDSAGSPGLWRQLRASWGRAEAARGAGDEVGWREAYEEVGLLIERGVAQSGREVRVVSLMEKRRKHADSQLKREMAEKHTWTFEEAAAFYTALGTAVRKNVPDREQLMRIENDLAALVGRSGTPTSP